MDLPVNGLIDISSPLPLVAGSLTKVVFTYTAGSEGMAAGGRLRAALPNPGWSQPLTPQHYFWESYQTGKDRRYTNYDRVNTTAHTVCGNRRAVPFLRVWAGFLEPFSLPRRWLRNYDRWWIEVTLEDDGLDPGDQIIVTYGDPARLPLTARVQGFPDRKIAFLAYVDCKNNGSFEEVAGSPHIQAVESGPPSRLDVVAPSIVRPGEPIRLRVAYTDEVKTQPREAPPVRSLKTRWNGAVQEIAVGQTASSLEISVPGLDSPNDSGIAHSISIEDPQRQWTAETNPFLVRNDGPKLYWGDLHAQSQYHSWCPVDEVGIGCGTPEEIYSFGRHVAGLDFCAITDTDSICNDIWPAVRQAALAANEDGQFVVFQGTEGGDNTDGHRNILFATSAPEPGVNSNASENGSSRFAARRAQDHYHGREDVMLVYHHTKMWNNWSHWDPTLESVVEIYSSWGSGEKAGTERWNLAEMTGGVQEAWAKGYRLGVIAGSDTHVGTPGRNIANCERDEMLVFPNGIAGVWAEELTRAAIFDALKRRHCYGTTGVRIVLEVALDGYPMGSEIRWTDARRPRELCVTVHGTDRLQSLQIVKNNRDVIEVRLAGQSETLRWVDEAEAQSSDYYYVRVTQVDGHRAWSSPIWIDVE